MHTQVKKTVEFTADVLRSSLCDFSDSHLVLKGATADTASDAVIFKISFITEINKSWVHEASEPALKLCQHIFWLNIVIIILKHLEVYGNIIEMEQLLMMIFLLSQQH